MKFFLALLMGIALVLGGFGQAAFRAVGGPGLERGEVVVPHSTGAFLVATSKLEGTDVVRGYLVHYDADLNVDWTRLLPTSAAQETPVDAWTSAPGTVSVLTSQLVAGEGYLCAIHTVDSTGAALEVSVPQTPQNFRPVRHVTWQNESWLVGSTGSQPCAVNLATAEVRTWGGAPGALDEINDATVSGSVLVAVGSRTVGDTTSTAIWGVYPLGQYAFEHLGPDVAAGAWSEAVAVDEGTTVLRVLHSYRPPAPNDQWLLHSLISVSPNSGQVTGVLYGPSGGQRPGRDVTWTPQGWVKLTQTDGFSSLGESMLVTHYSENGAYQSQGAWGTSAPFEDDPSRVTVGDDGVVWVAGSTRGAIDPSWNACLLRLDSLGPLGAWSSDDPGFGIYNDPLFDDVLSVGEALNQAGVVAGDEAHTNPWRCVPNPASDRARLACTVPLSDAERAKTTWVLRDALGREVAHGRGAEVDLSGVAPGLHHLVGTVRGSAFHVSVLVE